MASFGTVTYVWGFLCVYCGDAAETIDHVLPLHRGGMARLENLRPCCGWCNSHKRDSTPEEWLGKECPEWLTGFEGATLARHRPSLRPSQRRPEHRPKSKVGVIDDRMGTAGRTRRRRQAEKIFGMRDNGVSWRNGPPPLKYRPLRGLTEEVSIERYQMEPAEGVKMRPLPDGPVERVELGVEDAREAEIS